MLVGVLADEDVGGLRFLLSYARYGASALTAVVSWILSHLTQASFADPKY
jgi:hypothetical protein